MRILNKEGQRFNRLLVVKKSDKKYRGRSIWICKCDCGNVIEVIGSRLMGGGVQSCGCLRKDLSRLKGGRGKTVIHGMSKTRPWRIWVKMRNRCENSKENNYERYGGRGISVCDRWSTFMNFWNDMKEGYADYLTIDRINNSGNYEPGNCIWATVKEQAKNRRIRKDGKFTKKYENFTRCNSGC